MFKPYVEAASALAIIASSHEPLLFLDDRLRVIAGSASFCRAFEIDPHSIVGAELSKLGKGEWSQKQLAGLLNATASGAAQVDSYEMELLRPDHKTRHLLLNARRLEDGDTDHTRLLLAITDVTEERANLKLKDDLVREKAILLQEVQHRIANSLQIIASVLMQGAKRVQSEEARGPLRDAHHRVMSIAAVQQQLSASTLGEVQLRPYFIQLCKSLAASMIDDPSRLDIVVTADDSETPANVSISLGLIVTELVINALKHAFPGDRPGTITVSYEGGRDGWTLSVSDDGIGMPDEDAATPGLGTGIVEALAKQLQAEITVESEGAGTSVRITRFGLVVASDRRAAAQPANVI